jgi:transposase-like protein
MIHPKPRHNPEEIVEKLHRSKQIFAEGASVEAACRILDVGPATLYRWRKQYGGMTYRQVHELHDLQIENRYLKSRLRQMGHEIRELRSTLERNS